MTRLRPGLMVLVGLAVAVLGPVALGTGRGEAQQEKPAKRSHDLECMVNMKHLIVRLFWDVGNRAALRVRRPPDSTRVCAPHFRAAREVGGEVPFPYEEWEFDASSCEVFGADADKPLLVRHIPIKNGRLEILLPDVDYPAVCMDATPSRRAFDRAAGR